MKDEGCWLLPDERHLAVPTAAGQVELPETEAERAEKLVLVTKDVGEGPRFIVKADLIKALAFGLRPPAAHRALDALRRAGAPINHDRSYYADGYSMALAKATAFATSRLALRLCEAERDAVIDQLVEDLEKRAAAGAGYWVGEQVLRLVPLLTRRARRAAKRIASRGHLAQPGVGPVWSASIHLELAATASSAEEATDHV